MDIKTIIKEKGLTIQDVADKMGINRVTLAVILNGAGKDKSPNPTYEKMKQIAAAIECDVMDFFKDEATHQKASNTGLCCPNCGCKLELRKKED